LAYIVESITTIAAIATLPVSNSSQCLRKNGAREAVEAAALRACSIRRAFMAGDGDAPETSEATSAMTA
jgi:hypothetical protein